MTSLKLILAAALGMMYGCGQECEMYKKELSPTIYTGRYDDPEAHQLDLDTLEGKMTMTHTSDGYFFDCTVEPKHRRFEFIITKIYDTGDYTFLDSTEGLPYVGIQTRRFTSEELDGVTIKCNIFLPNWMFVVGRDEWGNEKTRWQARRAVGTVEATTYDVCDAPDSELTDQ